METPKEACFIPYVDFVAQHVDPATLEVRFTSVTSYNGTITSHTWDFGDGTSFTGEHPPPHTYPVSSSPAGNTYRIRYTVANACGEAFWTRDITVTRCLPDTKFSYIFLNDSTVQFTNETTSPSPATFLWNFGDGTTSSSGEDKITFSYHKDQNYTVSLMARNSCGENFYTSELRICRKPVPRQTLNISSCSSVTLDASGTSHGAKYQWNFGNGVVLPASPSPAASITYTYPSPGSFTITLSVINEAGCDTSHLSVPVTITAGSVVPNSDWTYSSDDLDFHFSRPPVGNAASYSWDFGDGSTSALQNPDKSFSSPGNYALSMEASNSCDAYRFAASVPVPFYKAWNKMPETGFMDVEAVSAREMYFLGTNGKLYKTDTAGNWSNAINLPSKLDFNNNTRLFKDIYNRLWIYGKGEIARLDGSNLTWTPLLNSMGFSGSTTINSIAVDNNGNLWAIDEKQIRRGNTLISSSNSSHYSSIAFSAATGRIWITSDSRNQLYYIPMNGNQLSTVGVSGIVNGASQIRVHPNGDVFFATGTGIIRTNGSGTLINNYNSFNTAGLLSGEPRQFDFDNEGNMWVLLSGRLLKVPISSGAGSKNYSFNNDLSNIASFCVWNVNGTDNDLILAKTTGNAAIKIK